VGCDWWGCSLTKNQRCTDIQEGCLGVLEKDGNFLERFTFKPCSPPGKKGAAIGGDALRPETEEEEVFRGGGGRVWQVAQWNQRSNALHPL